MSASVDINIRPIKFAFLVNPNDKKTLLEIIKANTFLWGGIYNPIIPCYKKRPRKLKNIFERYIPPKEFVKGYLECFDPDFIIETGAVKAIDYGIDNNRIVTFSALLGNVSKYAKSNYGLCLFLTKG